LAVIPVGAIEAHNLHLPAGTDFLTTDYVARACCRKAWNRCRSVLCLPALPFGVDCNLMAYPPTVHVSQQALDGLVREIIVSLTRHGLGKFVILNGHGGNEFLPLVRQVQYDLGVHVFVVDWWKAGHDRYKEFFTAPDDHAGQMETSIALALFPERVELESATDGAVRPYRFAALRQGWARTSRDFARMSDHCASGNPAGASAEAGRKYLDLTVNRIADFLVELANCPMDEYFPFAGRTKGKARGTPPRRRKAGRRN
jgi:creatinine amidohydrolase